MENITSKNKIENKTKTKTNTYTNTYTKIQSKSKEKIILLAESKKNNFIQAAKKYKKFASFCYLGNMNK